MADFYIDAGELRAGLRILRFSEILPNHYAWVAQESTRASLTWLDKRSIFSQRGMGVQGATLVLRRLPIQMKHAFSCEGQFLLPTSILPRGRQYMTITVACVFPVVCHAERFSASLGEANRPLLEQLPTLHFPAFLTEKYQGYAREDSHAAVTSTRILVCPKEIGLREGDLVTVTEGAAAGEYAVQLCYLTDKHRNEYEITHRRDV